MAGRSKMSHVDQKEDVHQHSGWLIPAVFLFAIMLLSGLFLARHFGRLRGSAP